MDLEDPDAEGDEDSAGKSADVKTGSPHPKQKLQLEVEDKNMGEHEKEMVRVRNSAKKIERNLGEAEASIKRR